MIDISIILPPLLAGLLVLLTHVPLGQRVLQRGIIFIDLALAQIAGLGVIIAQVLGWHAHDIGLQVIAVSSALIGALLLYWFEKRWAAVQEAVIGLTFVLAATAAILFVAGHAQGLHQIDQLLNGQILWVQYGQLWPIAILSIVVLVLWYLPFGQSTQLKFYLLFALSVTASVQLVGVYLVFASLIVPALALSRLQHKGPLLGYVIGFFGYLLGVIGSALFDLPTGPLIVWMLLVSAVAIVLFCKAIKRH